VDDENGTETRLVTVNQVVAWNMAWFRRAAGLTQKQLGDLISWTNTAVSAAERSWDGRVTREFDARDLAFLSLALGVPLIALLLPPEDGGTYAFAGPDGQYEMRDLMALVVMTDSAGDTPAMDAYRDRLRGAAARYLDPEWADEVADWLSKAEPDDALADRAAQLRARQADLKLAAAEMGDLASAIENRRRRT